MSAHLLIMVLFATQPNASMVSHLNVPSLDRSKPRFGKPYADGKSVIISFPRLTRVMVSPYKQSAGNDYRCSVRLTSTGATPQTVMTMPTLAEAAPDMVPTVCLSLRAFGRIPSKAGTYRIGLIYSGFTGYVLRPDNSYIVPVILTRTNRSPNWVIDDVLGSKLTDAGIETVPAMRRWLEQQEP
jgi:hypothetical protein